MAYSDLAKRARMDAVTTTAGTTAKLELGTAGMAAIIATIPLANPIAPASAGAGVLTLTMPQSDTSADATGTPVEARIRTGADADVITGLTVGTSGTDIVLGSAGVTAGDTVTINSAVITHAA